nr:hypothetical protein [Tanacetum cinerariifolium]
MEFFFSLKYQIKFPTVEENPPDLGSLITSPLELTTPGRGTRVINHVVDLSDSEPLDFFHLSLGIFNNHLTFSRGLGAVDGLDGMEHGYLGSVGSYTFNKNRICKKVSYDVSRIVWWKFNCIKCTSILGNTPPYFEITSSSSSSSPKGNRDNPNWRLSNSSQMEFFFSLKYQIKFPTVEENPPDSGSLITSPLELTTPGRGTRVINHVVDLSDSEPLDFFHLSLGIFNNHLTFSRAAMIFSLSATIKGGVCQSLEEADQGHKTKVGKSVQRKVRRETKVVHELLKYCVRNIDKNAVDILELVNLIRDLVILMDPISASAIAATEGENMSTQAKKDPEFTILAQA